MSLLRRESSVRVEKEGPPRVEKPRMTSADDMAL
jgi:hypothetical protein